MRHTLITLLLATHLTTAMAATPLALLLRQMPVGTIPLLTENNLLDLLDTYEAGATTPIRNTLGDIVRIDSLSETRCQLTLSPSTTVTFQLSGDSTFIQQAITTTATSLSGITAHIRRTYTTDWQSVADHRPLGTDFAQ